MTRIAEIIKETYSLMSREELLAACINLEMVAASLRESLAERDALINAMQYYLKTLKEKTGTRNGDGTHN